MMRLRAQSVNRGRFRRCFARVRIKDSIRLLHGLEFRHQQLQPGRYVERSVRQCRHEQVQDDLCMTRGSKGKTKVS